MLADSKIPVGRYNLINQPLNDYVRINGKYQKLESISRRNKLFCRVDGEISNKKITDDGNVLFIFMIVERLFPENHSRDENFMKR